MHYLRHACFFSLLAIIYAAGNETSGCLEKEKALALLETAEGLLSKARDAFPSCKLDLNTTNGTDCKGEKPLAYIEISKQLISDVREHFPTCTKTIDKDDKIVPKPIEEDDKTTTKPIEGDDQTTPKPIEKEDKIVPYDKPKDCSQILENGHNESGVYIIWLSESNTTRKPLLVYCDMNTENGGWTVIQRRGKYPVQQDFYLGWESYKNGFGNLVEEFWLGNENIRLLCHKGCEIRFDLEDAKGEKGFALYRNFKLSFSNYTIDISGYTGNVGDSMQLHNNLEFSTKDHGQTERAARFKGGWWYIRDYLESNLNGIFQPGTGAYGSIFWIKWRHIHGLAAAEMKVRPN